MRRLYLFVLSNIGLGESLNLSAAIEVLTIIRDGLESVRGVANELERRGQVPHAPTHAGVLQNIVG